MRVQVLSAGGLFFRTTREEVSGHEAVWKMFGRRAHRSRHSSLNIEGGGAGGFIFALTGRKVGWFVTL